MDDERHYRQYDYKANSNLVLQADRSERPRDEGTGEVQSLVGRLTGSMGDRARSSKPAKTEDEDKPGRSKKSKKSKKEDSAGFKFEPGATSLSVAMMDVDDLIYQPKSEATRLAYDMIVKFVKERLGAEHPSIITAAADEVISSMKNQDTDEGSRRSEVHSLLAPDEGLDDDEYNQLSNLCKRLTDWSASRDEANAGEAHDDTAIILSDNDDLSDDEYKSELDDSEEEEEFDLDDMFEKAAEVSDTLNIEELAKRYTNLVPHIDIEKLAVVRKKEGYQEYEIAPGPRPKHRDNLIKIDDLTENERQAFKGFRTLNIIQSMIYKRAMTSDKSLLICAPTGAGKTNIALLTMLREILKYPNRDGDGFDTDKFKIIYVAPIKALVQEIVENFSKKLSVPPFNLQVKELTGDHQLNQREISDAQIIVCTPEKWDIVTRKSLDRLYTKIVRLVIFDEIHLLHNERGATLEALVARIKRHKQIEGESIRIVGLSATLPNYKDVSRFIAPDVEPQESTFYFDSTYRPIPLKQQYIAMTETKKSFRMINDIVYDKVIERLKERVQSQILIFVHSRPDTFKTADFIKRKALELNHVGLFLSSESAIDAINEYSDGGLNPKLKELLQFGIGTHHAGMSKHERTCVEELFRNKFVKVLVSTATLAWGVNLPARIVIIKGTQVYREGRWTDLDSLDVTQMLGRAGRPGYDNEGEGIVITQQSQVKFYMSLMTEQLPVESRLIGRLAECINSECVIGNVESLDGAIGWLNETYLSSRMASVLHKGDRNYTSMYGIKDDAKITDPNLNNHKRNLAYDAVRILCDRGLVVFDKNSGDIKSTELGRIASNYNCSSRTIKLFNDSIQSHTTDIELFRIFSMADEFKDIFVRRGEEADLMTLINQVPFPIDDKRATAGANKVNALLQVYIFRLNIEGSDLICDMHFIRDSAARLARAIHEIVLMKGFANVAELSFDLCRKIDKRMTACHSPLRQFSELDPELVNKLEKKNYHLEELRVLEPEKLTELLRCDRHQGKQIFRLLKCLPKLKIEAGIKPISNGRLRVEVSIEQDFTWKKEYHGYSERFWLLVEDVNQERLLHHELIHLKRDAIDGARVVFFIPYLIPAHPFYYIRIMPDNWFGCDHHLPIYIEKLTLPEEPLITTQLEDLDPKSIRSLQNPLFEAIYESKFKGSSFNQIQTFAFDYIYKSNDDVILLASAGSGKTVCAELAVMRDINLFKAGSKCGYIAANSQAARLVYEDWVQIFGQHYGVYIMTGKRREDSAKVESSNINIVIGDRESWHSLTLIKPKRYKKLMSKFQLFIIDDIHLLHNDHNSTLEWLCAKLRIATKLDSKTAARIITLGSPIVNADSLKNWLAYERGSREPVVMNFPPSIRPVKLESTIQRYHHYDYKMRLMTMYRPVYRHITQTARDKPTLVFVSDYQQALDLCNILINYSKGEKIRFASSIVDTSEVRDSDQRRCIRYGMGFLYRGMHPDEKRFIEDLYNREQILVLVATVGMCWSIKTRSYLTIIMDTQQHDGQEARDYELVDIMQMIGYTGRPLQDHECKCIIMCQSSKAENFNRALNEPLPVESDLPVNLISHVNYEVIIGTIGELNNIYKPFLAYTYFYKRITINPNYYGVVVAEDSDIRATVSTFFNDLVNKVALELAKSEFVSIEGSREDPKFTGGQLALISLEYYISYETILNYSRWLKNYPKTSQVGRSELIELISTNTHEFRRIQVRHGELMALRSLKRRYKQNDQSYSDKFKVKLLILSQYQKTDGKEDPLEGELIEDRQFILATAHRLLMAIVDIAWLQDTFSLAKNAIQLAKKLVPYSRRTKPDLDMSASIIKEVEEDEDGKQETKVVIDISVERADDPFDLKEFEHHYGHLPSSMYRDEGWCFLVIGKLKNQKDLDAKLDKSLEREKFQNFKRVKTPVKGVNEYKLEFTLPEISEAYTYDLYFMSDFYSSSEDRRVPMESL